VAIQFRKVVRSFLLVGFTSDEHVIVGNYTGRVAKAAKLRT
jgi:hypothetical protein